MDQINAAYSGVDLKRSDIDFVHVGLLPVTAPAKNKEHGQVERHYQVWDHSKQEGVEGILSVMGVKYTTARFVCRRGRGYLDGKNGRDPCEERYRKDCFKGWGNR